MIVEAAEHPALASLLVEHGRAPAGGLFELSAGDPLLAGFASGGADVLDDGLASRLVAHLRRRLAGDVDDGLDDVDVDELFEVGDGCR